MREVNFSVPAANRASTGITTALYDRRALDCTATLPLINSLNHLAYLTLSSPRIRQILTLDGGVERLVAMLKKGKSKNMLENWKWHLALQCVVNIGVRGSDARASDAQGSEAIRTRVVEADIVPVIATVLDNYMQAVEGRNRFRRREGELRVEELGHRRSEHGVREITEADSRSGRRRPPPPIHVETAVPEAVAPSAPSPVDWHQSAAVNGANPDALISSPIDPSLADTNSNHHHRTHRSETLSSPSTERPSSPVDQAPRQAALGLREPYLFPRAAPGIQDVPSQPETPTTPTAQSRSANRRRSASAGVSAPRAFRQASSMSGDSDEGETSTGPSAERTRDLSEERLTQVNTMDVEMEVQPNVLDAVEAEEDFPDPEVAGDADSETFNIRHRSVDGSLVETEQQPINTVFAPVGGMIDHNGVPDNSRVVLTPMPPPMAQEGQFIETPQPTFRRSPHEEVTAGGIMAWTPHDEDVIMSLQLLAYVSKYCVLRSYFQETHLVPSLRVKPEPAALDDNDEFDIDTEEEDHDNEYLQADDYNIFPLVEKFTVRHYSADMKYWACVVMRNLCRKDKTRGDIRQCAYYKCGKWEQYARQFAKCRRCRQTKYCSKECQKNAWVYHRHWCEPARESYQRHQHSHTTADPVSRIHAES